MSGHLRSPDGCGNEKSARIVAKKLLPRNQAGFVPEMPPFEDPFVLLQTLCFCGNVVLPGFRHGVAVSRFAKMRPCSKPAGTD